MLNTLIMWDCLEVMKSIPDGSIDAIITDPPYGTTACKWDTIIPFEPMWEQLKRVTKKNGAIVLFGSQPFTSALVMSNPKMFRYQWIWEKDKGANFLQGNFQPLKVHEDVNVFAIGKTIYNPQKTINPKKQSITTSRENHQKRIDAGLSVTHFRSSDVYEKDKLLPRSVQYFTRNVPRGGTLHPTQKPVALLEYLIKTYTKEWETVLDFTAGSWTTWVACKNTGRNYILIEKDEWYCNIIRNRLSPSL